MRLKPHLAPRERAMPPLALSDDQMTQILRSAEPLAPHDRSQFVRDVAASLQGRAEIGHGSINQVCARRNAEISGRPICHAARIRVDGADHATDRSAQYACRQTAPRSRRRR
jgi:hypothetical protein